MASEKTPTVASEKHQQWQVKNTNRGKGANSNSGNFIEPLLVFSTNK
ncbi:hypothetical protein [Psychroserpens burtonensis]|nr:hypothetical protein [Psychroserpens burtonensis]